MNLCSNRKQTISGKNRYDFKNSTAEQSEEGRYRTEQDFKIGYFNETSRASDKCNTTLLSYTVINNVRFDRLVIVMVTTRL